MQQKANNGRVLNHLIQKIKQQSSHQRKAYSLKEIAHSSVNMGHMKGKRIERVIFFLRGVGCSWCNIDFGGCTMCGHFHETTKGEQLPNGFHLQQFLSEYNKYDFRKYPMVCIYNAGSLLNCDEISNYDFCKILEIVESNQHINHLIIESRPEFATEENLRTIKKIIKNTTVEIGIGLESSSDKVRDICVNKGFSFDEYKQAAERINNSGFKLLTYITVKPLFLTIDESVNDVVNSLKKINGLTDVVSLEPTSIQKGTLVEYFYSSGFYSPPKGWIIQDILSIINKNIGIYNFELRVGGFEFYPIPDLVIGNCEICNELLYKAIDRYNTDKDINGILKLKCSCMEFYQKNKFIENIKFSQTNLDSRISEILSNLLIKINYSDK